MQENKLLIVDDNEDICMLVKQYMELHHYEVETCTNSIKALEYIFTNQYNLIILDIMMKDLDGIELCQIIRDKVMCPIVFLSAKSLKEDKIEALCVGGDDYITKPFSLEELLARVECHLRREQRVRVNKKEILNDHHILLDGSAKEVYCKGVQLKLTKKEYGIVELFMHNRNVLFSKETIFSRVWGEESESFLDTVTESIKNIRRKIRQQDTEYTYIHTVYGLGYRWEAEHEKG